MKVLTVNHCVYESVPTLNATNANFNTTARLSSLLIDLSKIATQAFVLNATVVIAQPDIYADGIYFIASTVTSCLFIVDTPNIRQY